MPEKLGQHFLKNKNKIRKIIDSLNLVESDKILEIGPGKGALTKELGTREGNFKIKAVERDERLISYLNKKVIPEIEKKGHDIEIIYGNILKALPELSSKIDNFKEYKVVGNIPYYITGKLFRVFEEIERKPSLIILTVQREVADRVVEKPPNMNILSASVGYWAKTEKLFNIPKGNFDPVPEVDSAVIKLKPKDHDKSLKENYYKMINIIFNHSRKTVLNNLSIGLDEIEKEEIKDKLNEIKIDSKLRPQNLSVESLISITKAFN